MPRMVDCSDERIEREFKIWFKQTLGREPTISEGVELLDVFMSGWRRGFEVCKEANYDDQPD